MESRLCGCLIPVSPTAQQSIQSAKEKCVDVNSITGLDIALAAFDIPAKRSTRCRSILPLQQSEQVTYFTVGSARNSYLPLTSTRQSSPTLREEEVCWIQLTHCLLCPDPDADGLWLYNSSRVPFTLHGRHIAPGARLGHNAPGLCTLNLGSGVDFLLFLTGDASRGAGSHATGAHGPGSNVTRSNSKDNSLPRSKAARRLVASTSHTCSLRPGDASHRAGSHAAGARDPGSNVTRSDSEDDSSPRSMTIRRLIASTPHSEVFHVETSDGQFVEKCIRNRDQDVLRAHKQWQRENKIHQRVAPHPHLVQYLSSDAANLTLRVEYVRGGTLADSVDEEGMSKLSRDQALRCIAGVAAGLDHLHGCGVHHRDVKPQNIMVTGPTLIDFGSATLAMQTEESCGTAPYMAPEYMVGPYGQASDIFALGIVSLFALGYIPIPRQDWPLRHVKTKPEVSQRMTDWITEIDARCAEARKQYPWLENMLVHDLRARSDAKAVQAAVRKHISSERKPRRRVHFA